MLASCMRKGHVGSFAGFVQSGPRWADFFWPFDSPSDCGLRTLRTVLWSHCSSSDDPIRQAPRRRFHVGHFSRRLTSITISSCVRAWKSCRSSCVETCWACTYSCAAPVFGTTLRAWSFPKQVNPLRWKDKTMLKCGCVMMWWIWKHKESHCMNVCIKKLRAIATVNCALTLRHLTSLHLAVHGNIGTSKRCDCPLCRLFQRQHSTWSNSANGDMRSGWRCLQVTNLAKRWLRQESVRTTKTCSDGLGVQRQIPQTLPGHKRREPLLQCKCGTWRGFPPSRKSLQFEFREELRTETVQTTKF